jgi:hypothetical protein
MMIKRTREIVFVALLAAIVLASLCFPLLAQIREPWLFKMAVRKFDGHASFEFYREEGAGSTRKRSAVRVALLSVYAGDNPQATLWQITAIDERGATDKITYGVVPEGFTQVVPMEGTAPPLKTGEKYSVSATGEGIAVNSFVF